MDTESLEFLLKLYREGDLVLSRHIFTDYFMSGRKDRLKDRLDELAEGPFVVRRDVTIEGQESKAPLYQLNPEGRKFAEDVIGYASRKAGIEEEYAKRRAEEGHIGNMGG